MRRRSIERAWCLLLLLGLFAPAYATPLNLTPGGRYDLFERAELIPDPDRRWDYREALDAPAVAPPNRDRLRSDGGRYWLRLTLRTPDVEQALQLRCANMLFDQVDFYVLRDGALLNHAEQGRLRPMPVQPLELSATYNLPLLLPAGSETTLLVSLETSNFSPPMVELLPQAQAWHEANVKTVITILTLGMVLLLIGYNLTLWPLLRDPCHLWYALYGGAYVAYFLYFFGYMPRLLDSGSEGGHYFALLPNITQLAGLLFALRFLQLEQVAPRLARLFKLLALLVVVQVLLFPLLDPHSYTSLNRIGHLLHGPLIIAGAWIALRRGVRHAILVLAGWGIMTLTIFWAILSLRGLFTFHHWTGQLVLIAITFDMFLLSFALAYRYRDAETERLLLRRQDEVKNRFLATLSHEVRTPLCGLLGDIRQCGVERRELAPALHRLEYSGQALLSLLDNLLLYSKAAHIALRPRPERFDPRLLAESVVALFQERAQRQQTRIDIELDPALPAELYSDPLLLRQILINLLSNAVKHTQQGWVRLGLGLSAPGQLRLVVADSGVGIPEAEQGRILEQFYQLGDRQHAEGLGLGLYLVGEMVSALAGEFALVSAPGRGTEVTLRLPLAQAPPVAVAPLAGYRLLLVDDDGASLALLREHMERHGAQVEGVGSLAKARARLATGGWDGVVSDLHLDDAHGAALITALREAGGAELALHAMSASSDARLHAQVERLGARVWLKPVALAQLVEALRDRATAQGQGVLDAALLEAHRAVFEPAAFAALIAEYQQAQAAYLGEIDAAISARQWAALARHAHKLAGSAAAFGLPEVGHCAERLEQAAQADDSAGVAAAHLALKRAVEASRSALARHYPPASDTGDG